MGKSLFKISWFAFLLLVIASLILMSCSSTGSTTVTSTTTVPTSPTTAAQTPQYGGVLRIVPKFPSKVFGYSGDMANSSALDVSIPCLEALCGADNNGEFVPILATAYELAPDGKSITFTLRQGVKFHDGTDFNAGAAKWNLEQMKKARIAGTESWTTQIDAVDEHTVRINLKSYQSTFIGQMASISRISSPAAFEKYGLEQIHTQPVGTGPFKFVSFTPDVGITWDRNDDYWGGKPYLEGIETIYITDDMAKSAAMQSNGVDVIFSVTSETGVALRSKGYNVTACNQESLICLVPDSANADSPLSNLKVRQAIEYAIDRNALKELGNGFWTAANQPSTPNTPGYVQDFKGREYDPGKAQQLLAEAGYPNGFNISMIYGTANVPADTMTAVAQFLSKVGITLDLQSVTANQRTDYSMNGWNKGLINGIVFSNLNYLSGIQYNLSPGGNVMVSAAKPDGFGELLTRAGEARDMATAAQYYQQIDMMLYENATIIPLWVAPQQIYVEQTYVHGAGLYSTGAQFEWTPEKAWLSKQ